MQSNTDPKSKFNLSEFIRQCRRRWKLFAASIIVFGVLGGLWLAISQPRSEVIANVLISEDDGGGGGLALELASSFSMGDMFGGSRSVDDELAVMTSHTVFRNTVKDLGLNVSYYENKNLLKKERYFQKFPLTIDFDKSIADTLSVIMKFKIHVDADGKASVKTYIAGKYYDKSENLTLPAEIKTPYGDFTFGESPYYRQGEDFDGMIALSSYDASADAYAKTLEIFILNKKTDMISLSLVSTDPQYACKIVNTVIDNYNMMGIKEKQLRDGLTARFIETRLQSLVQELDSANSKVETYKRDNQIVDVEKQAELMLESASLQTEELLKAETEYSVLGMIRDFIANPSNRYSLIPVLQSGENELSVVSEYNDLILKRMSIESSAKSNNASLKLITGQIDALRDNVLATVDKQYDTAGIRLAQVKSQIEKSTSMLSEVPSQERHFLDIKRQQVVKEQLYIYLLKQREETAMSISNARPRALIIDAAYISTVKVGLSGKMKLALMLFLGMLVPLIIVFVRERMKGTVSNRDDVAGATRVPVLGDVNGKCHDGMVVIGNGVDTPQAEQFRLMRSNLTALLADNGGKSVMVTSLSEGEGKTFVSVNIAAALSLLDKRVVLVDMNLRNPQVADSLGIVVHTGLERYLSGNETSVEKVMTRCRLANGMDFDVIPASANIPNPSELLASDRVDSLVAQLKAAYDYVIMDTAAFGCLSDSRQLCRLSDVTICVVKTGLTKMKDIAAIDSMAGAMKMPVIVVNAIEGA